MIQVFPTSQNIIFNASKNLLCATTNFIPHLIDLLLVQTQFSKCSQMPSLFQINLDYFIAEYGGNNFFKSDTFFQSWSNLKFNDYLCNVHFIKIPFTTYLEIRSVFKFPYWSYQFNQKKRHLILISCLKSIEQNYKRYLNFHYF